MAVADDEDRGRSDLIRAILRVLPVEADGTTVIHPSGPDGIPVWGDPKRLARRILDALDSAYTDRDLQHEQAYMGQVEREEPF